MNCSSISRVEGSRLGERWLRRLAGASRLGLSGAMLARYPLEQRRYNQSEYEPFWAARVYGFDVAKPGALLTVG